MEIQDQGMIGSALVLGLGVSGEAAARLLLREGAEVVVVDRARDGVVTSRARRLEQEGACVRLGVERLPERPGGSAADFELCVVSPGVALDSDWMQDVSARGFAPVSELELGAARCRCPVLAVTGSNGKSTMVKLCAEAMTCAGLRVAVAGNYGTPVSEVAPDSAALDAVVLEVSSFQLETVRAFRPHTAVLLNVQADHLDRHHDMAAYRATKLKVFSAMGKGQVGIVSEDDSRWVTDRCEGAPRWLTFGVSQGADYRYEPGRVSFRSGGEARSVSVRESLFDNEVMGLTAAAAVAALDAWGLDASVVGRAASVFQALPHRMNLVREVNGVRFVDDSKATNLSALGAALRMASGSLRLIAGGRLKENNLGSVKELLAKQVRGVYVIGEAASKMAEVWGGTVPCFCCGELGSAVDMAWRDAQPGESIILCPGCASFDQFANFEDRGNQFMAMVNAIEEDG